MKKTSVFMIGLCLFLITLTTLQAKSPQGNKKAKKIKGTEVFLKNRISPSSSRHVTYQYVLNLMQQRNVKTIIETGTARGGGKNCDGDGCSTLIWGDWAVQQEAIVYSVDIDANALKESKNACQCCSNNIIFVESDSIAFLKNFDQAIDFLYLDSYDFDESNPSPSQEHHLKEIIAAYPHLHAKTIVMIDDCGLPYGGKGTLAIQYLLEHGWKIALSEYQVILIQEPATL